MRPDTRARRRRIQEAVKLYTGCECCGYNANVHALEWHHEYPSRKRFNCGETTRSLAAWIAEVCQCRCLCANCHAIEEHQVRTRHGQGEG